MSGTVINPDGRMRFDGLEVRLSSPINEYQQQIFFDIPLTHSGGISVPDVPDVTGDEYVPLALLDSNNRLLEIIHLTGYAEGATTGTVTRGQEGTAARPHIQGVSIVHAATIQDFLNVQNHANDPQPHRPYIDGLIDSITGEHIYAHTKDPKADPHPVYVRRDNALIGSAVVSGTLLIQAGGKLVVQGDLVVEGRLVINGYEIYLGHTPPTQQPDNLVWIQTVS